MSLMIKIDQNVIIYDVQINLSYAVLSMARQQSSIWETLLLKIAYQTDTIVNKIAT